MAAKKTVLDYDLSELEEVDLDELRRRVATEQERRQRLSSTVETVRQLSQQYVLAGGDCADLTSAVASAETPAEES